jgi:hypothetical protein
LVTKTEDQILTAVMDEMFGALEVDLHVPDHLKPTFAEMPYLDRRLRHAELH